MHLFGNMLFLWIYGDNVERRLGSFAFLFWYLATGAAATLTHALVFSSSDVPLVGASGSDLRRPRLLLPVVPAQRRAHAGVPAPVPDAGVRDPRPLRARHVPGVRQPAALLHRRRGRRRPRRAHRRIRRGRASWPGSWTGAACRLGPPTSRRSSAPPQAPTPCAGRSRTAGSPDAAEAYFALPPSDARGALDADEAVELAAWLRRNGHSEAALTLLRRVVRDVAAGQRPRRGVRHDRPAAAGGPRRAHGRVPVPAHGARARPPSRDRGGGAPRAPRDRRAPEAARRPAALAPALVSRRGAAPRPVPESRREGLD